MSRLDSFIRRMMAQRSVIDHVATLATGMPGPVFELGLGNGRTYDHLRERFPGRRIIAFDRALAAHPSSIPPADDLRLGEIRETALDFLGAGGIFAHADIGTGTVDGDARLARWLPGMIGALLAPGGFAASSSPLENAVLQALPLPEDVRAGRYFLYRRITL